MSRMCQKKVLVHCEPGCDVQTYIFTRMLVRFGCFTYCKLVFTRTRRSYHDLLPYIWIRASLWAHLMQRPNRIVRGDNLDVQWAAAYLPFVNFAITDGAFCKLLQESGLADLYGTKVYSLRTLNTLIDDLKSIGKCV